MASSHRHAGAIVLLGVLLGLCLGIGVFTFGYAKGASYLTDNPAACANCHVMRAQFAGWMKASHHKAAVCNDCHAPAPFLAKYTTKAVNGFFHSWAFTTGWFPDEIRITQRNYRVTDAACLKCHEQIVSAIREPRHPSAPQNCIRCHSSVGHEK